MKEGVREGALLARESATQDRRLDDEAEHGESPALVEFKTTHPNGARRFIAWIEPEGITVTLAFFYNYGPSPTTPVIRVRDVQ